jgi:hypothetical protein
MSIQCRQCLSWTRETSYGGPFTDGFRCDECGWEAPLALVDYNFTVYPIEGYLGFAEHFYYLQRLLEKHLVADDEPGVFTVADCTLKLDQNERRAGQVVSGPPTQTYSSPRPRSPQSQEGPDESHIFDHCESWEGEDYLRWKRNRVRRFKAWLHSKSIVGRGLRWGHVGTSRKLIKREED